MAKTNSRAEATKKFLQVDVKCVVVERRRMCLRVCNVDLEWPTRQTYSKRVEDRRC